MFKDPIEAIEGLGSDALVSAGTLMGEQFAVVRRDSWERAAALLKVRSGLIVLSDICSFRPRGNDGRLEVVAHLCDPSGAFRFRLKAVCDEKDLSIQSLTRVYPSADWYERECADACGIRFMGLAEAPGSDETLDRASFVDVPYGDATCVAPFGLRVGVDGARVSFAEVKTGYAHRGIEKLAMSVPWHFAHAVAEKINCQSPGIASAGCEMAIERLFGVAAPRRAMWLRMILCESWRACEHTLAVARCFSSMGLSRQAAALMMEARSLVACIESCFKSKGRGQCVRIGGMARDMSPVDTAQMEARILKARQEIERAARIAEKDPMFAARTRGTGVISQHAAEAWGITGPCLRAAGSGRDLRKSAPYLLYAECDWDVPTGIEGDAFDRITVMLAEALESLRIIKQAIAGMEPGPVEVSVEGITLPTRSDVYGSREGLRLHEGLIRGDAPMPCGEIYSCTEASAGELGFYLVSDGAASPAMFRVRSPSFAICQAAPMILKGCMLEDLPVVVASLGASASEADR